MTRGSQPSSCPKMGHGHTWDPSDEEEKMVLETRSTLTKKTLTLMLQKSMWTCTSMGAVLCPNMDTHTHTSTTIMVACNGQATPFSKLYPKCCLMWYAFPSWLWIDLHIRGSWGIGLMNHSGVHMVITHSGLPHGSTPHKHGVPLLWERISTRHTHFMDSPSSSLSGGLGLHHGSAWVCHSSGGSIKKMVQWLTNGEYTNLFDFCSLLFPLPLYSSPSSVLKPHH